MKLSLRLRTLLCLIRAVKNWPLYFLDRFGWVHGETTYKLRNGLKLTSRSFALDRGPLNDVWFDQSYEPNAYGIPFDWNQCKTIVDIGANIGVFTLFAAWKAPQSRIIAVEAEPSNAACAKKNVEQNNLENRVTVTPKACGKKNGTLELFLSTRNSGGNSMFEYAKGSPKITVPMISLQELFQEQKIETCDYLKLDCEGAEYDILYALPESTMSRIRFMAIEYHHFSSERTHQPEALRAFLEQRGFDVIQPKKSFFYALRR
ncbi:FkbM family methyltransferase [Candidatus Peribacteria bacterium]|nr:FkbM family methyltransferase [Candidatus Peribacteria bacterium]